MPTHAYARRGYFPADAESAFQRWRADATIEPPGTDEHSLEVFIKEMWLAGWRTRGQVTYGLPDVLPETDWLVLRPTAFDGQISHRYDVAAGLCFWMKKRAVARRALIAEDDRTFLDVLEGLVTELGFDVTSVADGEAALRIVFADRPDLLVVDMGLASVGGATLIRSLKAIKQDATVVAISGMGDVARQMAIAAGADVFLSKPFTSAALKRVVTDLIGS